MKPVRIIVALCLILIWPLALVSVQKTYFHDDVMKFSQWSVAWNLSSLRDLYVTCGTCNYPITGTLLSAGVIAELQKPAPEASVREIHQQYRLFLAAGDSLVGLAAAGLALLLGIGAPWLLGAFLTLLPSTWAGSASWGQVDGLTQLFLILALAGCLLPLRAKPEGLSSGKWRTFTYTAYVSAGLAIICALFLKQLTILSLPSLGLAWALSTFILFRGGARWSLLAVQLLLLFVFLRTDFYFKLPADWNSHLAYIFLGGGSDHGYKIGGNGFNIWVLLGRPQLSSSDVPFLGSLTPRYTGLSLFFLYNLFLFGSMLPHIRREAGEWRAGSESLIRAGVFVILSLGLANLSFNVFMAGTHQRHLYHSYPFILMALMYFRGREGGSLLPAALVSLSAILYGFFIHFQLVGSNVAVVSSFTFQALLHLALLCYLTVYWWKKIKN